MKKLKELWDEMPMKTDKFSVHSYETVYEELLAPYRKKADNILEIGLWNGASLLLWEKYFEGNVHGIDCSETPHDGMADLRPLIEDGTHNIYIGDATDKEWVDKTFEGAKFDVLIDDGGHSPESQIATVRLFADKMAPGSIMILEDIQSPEIGQQLYNAIEVGWKVEIIDLRHIKQRYDDYIIIIHF